MVSFLLLLLPVLAAAVSPALLRLYSHNNTEVIEGKLMPVLSLCENIPNTADFLLSLTSPCPQTPPNLHLFLISATISPQSTCKPVAIREKDLVRAWEGQLVWSLTLPEATLLSDIKDTVIGVESPVLPCPAQRLSDQHRLNALISTATVWNCRLPPPCPRLLANSTCDSNRTSACYESTSSTTVSGIVGIVLGLVW